jgi:hypothetical protein
VPVSTPPEGTEWRGFKFRVYPTADQVEQLTAAQEQLRQIWNCLVADAQRVGDARQAAAVRAGVVGPRPVRPCYDGLEPEQAERAANEHRTAVRDWYRAVQAWAKNRPECAYRSWKEAKAHFGCKQDYDVILRMAGIHEDERLVGKNVLAALAKRYQKALQATTRGLRPPVIKRAGDLPGLQDASSCGQIRLGAFGPRPGQPNGRPDWLNCQVKLAGLPWVSGRIGPEQAARLNWGHRLHGVSLTRLPDGWYAAIRHAQAPKVWPAVEPGMFAGIDVGDRDLAVIVRSDGQTLHVPNLRNREHLEQLAGRQAQGLPVSKMQQQAARRIEQLIRSTVVPFVADCEAVFVEALGASLNDRSRRCVSYLRGVVRLLPDGRVREVPPEYTSQDCSQCGFRSKSAWSHERKVGTCPSCGHSEDRDLNAARNILAKGLKSVSI